MDSKAESTVESIMKDLNDSIIDKKKNGHKSKKNSKKKKKRLKHKYEYNYYWNKYAEKLGLSHSNTDITTWALGKRYKKIKDKTGVDFRECFEFDMTLVLFIYSRLKAYKKYTICDLNYDLDRDFGDVHGTMGEAIDEVLKGLKLYLQEHRVSSGNDKYLNKCKKYLKITEVDETFKYKAPLLVCRRAFIILADLVPSLWD